MVGPYLEDRHRSTALHRRVLAAITKAAWHEETPGQSAQLAGRWSRLPDSNR
jgi:hypothetical protein